MPPVSKKGRQGTDFTTGPIVKQIVMFSIPTLLGEIFTALYNVVDTVVVGRYVGSTALAAVGCCFAITMVVIALCAGFAMGAGILTAQTFGAKDFDRLTRVANTAFLGGAVVSAIIMVLGELITVPLLRLMQTPESMMAMATTYIRIYFVGMVPQLFYFMAANMLRGMGDSKWPTYAMIFCALLNTVLDLVFVLFLKMECAGVALATVIAQAVSGIIVLTRLYGGNYGIQLVKNQIKIDAGILKRIGKIGVPCAIDRMVIAFGTIILTAFINGFGEDLVAANSIVQKVEQFAFLIAMSLGQALQMFVGQNVGAGNRERCNEGIVKGAGLIAVSGLIVGVICWLAAGPLCRIFVSNEVVIRYGTEAIRIITYCFIFHALTQALSSIIKGTGATQAVMYVGMITIVVKIVASYFMGVRTEAWRGLFWASNVFQIVSAALYVLYVWKGKWQQKAWAKKA